MGLKVYGGWFIAIRGLTYVTSIVLATSEISIIMPKRLVFLIIVKTNPTIIRFIVSETVVITIISKSLCPFLIMFSKYFEIGTSMFLIRPVTASSVIVKKHKKNIKICAYFTFQNGLCLISVLLF